MQTADGHFEQLTEGQAAAVREAEGDFESRVLREGQKVKVKALRGGVRDPYVIESIGKQFLWVRTLPGKSWSLSVGDEVTIDGCAFVVRVKHPRRLMLEGVPPETRPTVKERGVVTPYEGSIS